MALGSALITIGVIVYAGLAVWTFGFGHSHEPATPLFMWATALSVFGPMASGLALMVWAVHRK